MTQTTNAFSTYDAKGIREDLSEFIYDVSPTETPTLSLLPKVKATNTNHEWQTDSLVAAAQNAQIEADDITAGSITATTRVGNYTQISNKAFTIPATQDAVRTAGRNKETSYQLVRKTLELKRDMETSLVGLNNAKAVGNDSTARELASMQSWIATNTSKAGNGTDPTGDGSDARSDGTQRDFTEAQFKDVVQQIYTSGGNPTCAIVGAHTKQVASGFSGNSTRYDRGEDEKLYAAVHFYVSDFGTVQIIPDRFSRARDCLILDKNYWAIAELRPMTRKRLSEDGFYQKWAIEIEYTLEARNEASSGIVADLTTS